MKKQTQSPDSIDAVMENFLANAQAMENYQPQTSSAPSFRDTEPYLFEPTQENASLHPNGDTCIEDLTGDDMDLPIDFA